MDNDKNRKNIMQSMTRRTALYITEVAVMAGMLTAFKFALSFIPNVEVLTALIIVFASVWGIKYILPATLIFCTIEMAIYGVGSWVILYYIYWPLLAIVSAVCLKKQRTLLAVIIATIGGVLFGVLSSCADTLVAIGFVAPSQLGAYWVAYYVRGLWFDLIHVVSSIVTVSVIYPALCPISVKIKNRIYPMSSLAEKDDD